MRSGRGLLLLLLLFVLCSPALAQTIPVSYEDGSARASNRFLVDETGIDAPTPAMHPQEPAQPPPAADNSENPYGWHIAVYPVLAWAPVFGASVTLPPTPSQPITEPGPSGSTDSSLNGAYFGGARIEKGKWSADFLFMWAGLSAERETPFTKVNMDFVFGDALIGREVLHDLYLEGGVRRLSLDIDADVGTDSASRSPGFWDPIVGLTYRRQLGKKWRIMIHGDGGGFGVGSEADLVASGRAEWQFVRHFGLTMGYGGMHFSDSDTKAGRTLRISQTLHGPIFGFGIFF